MSDAIYEWNLSYERFIFISEVLRNKNNFYLIMKRLDEKYLVLSRKICIAFFVEFYGRYFVQE